VLLLHLTYRSPLDVTASTYDPQFEWGSDTDPMDDPSDLAYTGSVTSASLLPGSSGSSSSSGTGFNPLTSVLGTLDHDVKGAGGGAGGMPLVGPRRVRGPGQTFGAISFFTGEAASCACRVGCMCLSMHLLWGFIQHVQGA
jgi:hypothetical protein